jgi:high affinity Mn2+ porin
VHSYGSGPRVRRLATIAAFVGTSLATAGRANAQSASDPHSDDAFDFMNLLTRHDLHDIKDESWNAYGQFTYISTWKLPFNAKYTNLNGTPFSLSTNAERSFTASATLFLGVRLWPGAEGYFAPEVIAERPLSGLHGLGSAIQNFELQKTGSETPQVYRSRAYLKQTIPFGGETIEKTSDPNQLGTTTDSRRLVISVGNFSVIDFFGTNSFAGDLRRQFFNMSFMTYGAYDFAADARGFAFGGVAELYWDDWALRIGRATPPKDPNQLALDFRLGKYYGDQAELEHDHKIGSQAGAVRLLGYRNRENTGRFTDAIAAFQSDHAKNAAGCASAALFNYGSENANAPDLCWARKANVKVGIGINLEQHITEDIGVFFRGMISDGRTEVYSYTSTDRSASGGVLARGVPWHRPRDVAGAGVALGWISKAHADYLRMGGIDGFIGDGNIDPAPETALEVFYSFSVFSWLWLSADYQHIINPAFNADRGPVNVVGARAHAEF